MKTAAQLIAEYGDLDSLLARAGEIKQPKRRETLTNPDSVALIRISKQLVTLVRDVALEVPLDALEAPIISGPQAVGFLKAMEFTTIIKRLGEICALDTATIEADPAFVGPGGWRGRNGGAAPTPPAATPAVAPAPVASPAAGDPTVAPSPKDLAKKRAEEAKAKPIDVAAYETVRDAARLEAWAARARETGLVAFDTETNSLDPLQAALVGVSLALTPGEACYIPIAHREGAGDLLGGADPLPGQIPEADVIRILKPMLEDPGVLKIAQNAKFDWHMFSQRGVFVAPVDDTMLMSYALDAGKTSDGHGMDALSEQWLGHKPIAFGEVAGKGKNFIGFARVPIDAATRYAAEDADVTLRLWRVLKPRLPAEAMTTIYETLERPLIAPIAKMEKRGALVDRHMLSRLSGDFAQGMARLEAEIEIHAGERFNQGSPKAARRHPVRQDGPARRQEDRHRRVVDLGERARRSGRGRPPAAGENIWNGGSCPS